MKNFDLEASVNSWRKELFKLEGLEPEFIDELEESLRDRIDDYLISGISEEEAFHKAKEKVFPSHESKRSELDNLTQTKSGFYRSAQNLLPNFLKTAYRYFGKRKLFTAINCLSLTCTLVVTVLTFLFIQYETGFDRFHANAENIHRLSYTFRSQEYSLIPFVDYNSAKEADQMNQLNAIKNTEGVADACQFIINPQPVIFEAENKKIAIEKVLQTNSAENFFSIFSWNFLVGSKDLFSKKTGTLVLTESETVKLYGSNWRENKILGNSLMIDSSFYELAGVIEDVPKNSHFDFSSVVHDNHVDYWGARTYLLLNNIAKPEIVSRQLNQNIAKINVDLAESELFRSLSIQNIQDIHLYSKKLYEINLPGDERYLYILGIVAVIILLITLTNYTNLTIAMNAGRTREIGMRKVFGAGRGGIIIQFFIEAVALTLLTVPLAFIFIRFSIEPFNAFMDSAIDPESLTDAFFLLSIVGSALIVGILAGLYPAIYLSKLKIKELFKGNSIKANLKGFNARKAIITFQFFLLIGLISFTIFVNQQLSFIQKKDLGFKSENIVYVNLGESNSRFQFFKSQLLKNQNIRNVGTGSPMGGEPFNQTTYKLSETATVFDDAYRFYLSMDAFKMLAINSSLNEKIEKKQDLPKRVVMINRTAANKLMNQFNLSEEELLNRSIIEEPEAVDRESGESGFPFEISGIFDDINMFSLKEEVKPYFLELYNTSSYVGWVAIEYSHSNRSDAIREIKSTYEQLNTGKGFDYSFLEDNITELYKDDLKIGKLTVYTSLIAFLVAIIGLIALTSFMTTIKRKEIAIRKIIGASTLKIITLFNKEYIRLLVVATLLACPVTYLGISSWLGSFAYRIDVSWWVFGISFMLTLLISLLVVSIITYQVSNSKLVNAIKYD